MSNYLRAQTECALENYEFLVSEVKNLIISIEEVEEDYKGCGAMKYDGGVGSAGKFNSVVENEVINKDEKIKELRKVLVNKKKMLDRINNALNVLKDRERSIIEFRYIKGMNWEQTGQKVDLTAGYCRVLGTKIIDKMAKIIYVDKICIK